MMRSRMRQDSSNRRRGLHSFVRGLASTAVIALGLLLVGCVGIPQSGPVRQGNGTAANDEIDVIFQPAKPVTGASQSEILTGFIRAALNPQKDYEVAREFLSTSFAPSWHPDAGVTIDAGNRVQTVDSPVALSLTISPQADVDAAGGYSQAPSDAPIVLPYSFVQENGQWRINTAPDGIIMSGSEFNEVFRSYALYFFDPSFVHLVPDQRFFPRVSATTGTRIVRALLAGPTSWLRGAVVSAFPEGAGVTSVPVVSGQALVNLTGPVLETNVTALQRMRYQLSASLADLSGVSDVQMVVDTNQIAIATSNQAPPVVNPRVDTRALVLRAGVFGYFAGTMVTPIDGISDQIVTLDATSASYSAALGLAAVGTRAAGVYAVAAGQEPGVIDVRAGLIEPTIDPSGFIWTVPRDAPQAIQVSALGRAASVVQANWDGATSIESLDVARDGARLIALVTSGGTPRLVMAAIIRDAQGVPVSLGEPVSMSTGDGVAVDATWVDQLTAASVTELPSGDSIITQQQIGGPAMTLARSVNVVASVGANDPAGLRLLTADGVIQQQRVSAWQLTASGVTFLATQE
jgi:hypothetical protein